MLVSEIACDFNPNYEDLVGFHAGTEYEIEDVKSISKDGKTFPHSLSESAIWWNGFGFQSDGSLRNNGIEVITKPLDFNDSLKAFADIHNIVKVGSEAYTVRTSIHVHVNVLNWELEKVKDLLLLYALLEPVFFDFVGPGRKNNIHCVPLTYTMMPALYSKPIGDILHAWSKYTAINLMPVKTYGTVEFRHMFGTDSLQEYAEWLELIKDLWEYVDKQPLGFVKGLLSSGKSTKDIACSVFSPYPTYAVDFSTSTIDAKLAFI